MAATLLPTDPQTNTLIMEVYPSIAADAPGRAIGRVLRLFPLPFVNRASLIASLLAILLLPLTILVIALCAVLALGGYVMLKLVGQRYLLKSRSLESWSSLGQRLIGSVPLEQIAEISVDQKPGQEFFHAADLVVRDAGGNEVLTLSGVPRAEVFRQTILKARDAKSQVAAALATIGARSGG